MFPLTVDAGLELHLIQESDASQLCELIDRNRDQLGRWLSWVDHSRSPRDVAEHITKSLKLWEEDAGVTAALRADGQMAGTIGIHPIDSVNRHTSLGYWLDAAHQGRGLMTRACDVMVQLAFAHFRMHRVEIRCAAGNTKSAAIPQRLGFTREAVLREALLVRGVYLDLEVYSVLEAEWRGSVVRPPCHNKSA